MSKIKYKINGYWHEITVEGEIEAVEYTSDVPSALEINVNDSVAAEGGLV